MFLGIPLADGAAASLSRLALRLRSKGASLRWSAAESWHITLQFLGSTTPEQYECLVARLTRVEWPPVAIRLEEPGVFDRTGVFFAGVEVTPELAALQRRIVATTAQCGFEPEARAYRPHITLARSKAGARARELRGLLAALPERPRFPAFTAREFLLYESHLSPGGSRYEVRSRFQLAGSG